METRDLFPTSMPHRVIQSSQMSYRPPHTPRLPRSVQGSRNRSVPLPATLRSKPGTAVGSLGGTLGLGATLGSLLSPTLAETPPHAAEDIGAVIPYTLASESSEIALVDDESRTVESARTRYATFVRHMNVSADMFQSPSLFAEAVVREIQCRETTTPAMRVAAATWALDIISSQPGNETLRNIRNILMPALYVNFDDSFDPRSVPGGARSILHTTPAAVVAQNAFFTYDLYADQYLNRYQETVKSTQMTSKLQQLGLSRKSAITSMTESLAHQCVAFAFRAWRGRTRFKRFDRVSRENRILRRDEGARQLVLQNSFSVWKSHVERSRSIFLSERLHNAASQLENAKNQFQLQCFRSDKHLFTVEELRGELQTLRKDFDTLLQEKRELEKTLREFDVKATENLNTHVNSVLRELSSWRRFSRRCVEGLAVHAEIVKALEDQQRIANSAMSNSDDDSAPSHAHSSEPSAPTKAGKKHAAAAAAAADGVQDMNGTSEAVLLSWVQSVLLVAPLTPSTTTVSNFSTDFQSGEVMLLVLHSVFPNDVPLTPLQDATVSKRLERLVASFVKCGVAVVPRPSDFLDCNSDVIFIVLAELFGRNLQLQSLRKAKELMDGSYTGLEDPIASQIEYTQDLLPSILEGSKQEIQALLEQENTMRRQSGTLLKWQEAVGRDAAFATRERMSGNPVRAIGKSNVEKYWKFKVGRYADLEPKYRVKDEGWKDHLVGSLRRVLQKHVHTTSRLFFRFSWSSSIMNEVHFWRMAHHFKFSDKPMTPAAVEKIFSQVAKSSQHNPDLLDGPENVLLQEITPQDFVEILIRLADAKYTAKSLPDRVDQLLLAVHKASGAPSISSSAAESPMVQYLYSEASQKVLDQYVVDVVRIFLFYAKRHARGQSYARLLSYALHVDHLMQLLEDMGATVGEGNAAPFITHQQVLSVLKVVSAQDDGAMSSEFSFHQFMELLGSLSGYRTPDPLTPVANKLEILLTTMISRIRAKNKGSTLIVSDVRIPGV